MSASYKSFLDGNGQWIPGGSTDQVLVPASASSAGSNLGVANYGGLTPTITGTDGDYTIDSSNGRIWWWFLSQWN